MTGDSIEEVTGVTEVQELQKFRSSEYLSS